MLRRAGRKYKEKLSPAESLKHLPVRTIQTKEPKQSEWSKSVTWNTEFLLSSSLKQSKTFSFHYKLLLRWVFTVWCIFSIWNWHNTAGSYWECVPQVRAFALPPLWKKSKGKRNVRGRRQKNPCTSPSLPSLSLSILAEINFYRKGIALFAKQSSRIYWSFKEKVIKQGKEDLQQVWENKTISWDLHQAETGLAL